MVFAEFMAIGGIVGLSLGLTGAGGATIAVPLLVYILALDPPQAVAISLVSVVAAALLGLVVRIRRGDVDTHAGLVIAGGGIVGAPLGAWYGARLPETLLLAMFGGLVTFVSARMWLTAGQEGLAHSAVCAAARRLSWRCRFVLTGAGGLAGLLSGLFGVGGGFVVVPAVLFSTGTTMARAVGTSLMVVSIVSATALATMIAAGRNLSWGVAVPFLIGSLIGMAAGTVGAEWVPAARLQRGFAIALALIGVFVIVESLTRF